MNRTMISVDKVENIVGKGENAGYQHFLLFPTMFSLGNYLSFIYWFNGVLFMSCLGFTSTRLGLWNVLPKDSQWIQWRSNPGPLDYESNISPSHLLVNILAFSSLPTMYSALSKTEITINQFPHNDTFWHHWETNLLKTLWEKEKLLIISNFSFSHSVFYRFG